MPQKNEDDVENSSKELASGSTEPGYFSCVIPDMECADCAAKVEKALRRQAGILDLSINIMAQKATVQFDVGATDVERIAAAIREAGYAVEGADETEAAAEKPFWKNRGQVLTALSGVFFFLGLGVQITYPEAHHGPFWQGHLGLVDAFFLFAALVGGFNFFPAGLRALRTLSLDMDFLMTAAITGAVIIGEYTEAAAIAFLFSTAELLEDYALDRARRSLRALMQLAPETATVVREGEERVVPAKDVLVGEVVQVRPGEKIPVDGVVTEGTSAIDQAAITGESLPVTKGLDDKVYAGTLNQEGYLEIRTTQVAADTTLGKIIHMVEVAEENRSPSEQFVRRFARYYTPAVTVLALAVILIPPLAFDAAFATWFVRGLTLLVIACPCALVISTPVAVVSGITSAARNGVLIKGGSYLEALGEIKVVAFDKTGTLTHGKPEVTDVIALNGHVEADMLRIAAAAEQRSQHPIARAITRRVESQALPEVADFTSLTGKGVESRINGTYYRVGKPNLFYAIPTELIESLARDGKSVVLVGSATEVIGVIAVADTVRAVGKQTVSTLRSQGIKTIILTGDNTATAQAIAGTLGVDEWHAELLPQEKMERITQLRDKYGPVAMVGDGVNDAPALAAANVGVAMGAMGSDVALETADVALMGDDLAKLPYLFGLSKKARRVIRQNVWTSILVKFALTLGVFPGVVSLAAAVLIGDMGTSLLVTGNALRLGRTVHRPGTAKGKAQLAPPTPSA